MKEGEKESIDLDKYLAEFDIKEIPSSNTFTEESENELVFNNLNGFKRTEKEVVG